jgi:hypothetical protein
MVRPLSPRTGLCANCVRNRNRRSALVNDAILTRVLPSLWQDDADVLLKLQELKLERRADIGVNVMHVLGLVDSRRDAGAHALRKIRPAHFVR